MRVQNLHVGVGHPAHLVNNDLSLQSNASLDNCTEPGVDFQHSLYTVSYTIVFIPGLLTNSVALWILCRFISKQNKTVIFMINLATADFAHVLSLPLRIYYYINDYWPFGVILCQLCFYVKYLNMYASICFLTCISVQRYFFLLHPFRAKNWKRRYDVAICIAVWVFVGVACLPFPLMRDSKNVTSCFTEMGIKKVGNIAASLIMMTVAECVGFLVPLVVIVYCTWKTKVSLQEHQIPLQNAVEKQKALRMVSTCAIVFLLCFTPYHITFFFFMMAKEKIITSCRIVKSILYIHPFCLSLASLNCCLDPVLYFFTTSEFQDQISRHSSLAFRSRLMSKESASSLKE
ncbi:putative P2Y purinoceptor 10 [Paroedura picta]|uniref:putative P2Y purinoceptor 10 n=1 Tax=Paroedura picta TaxID=143630 RepID=UPI00405638A8